MTDSAAVAKSRVPYKTFTYRTRLRCAGRRAGVLRSDGKSELRVSSPSEFRGETGAWTPEDLLVAAVDTCLMVTFLAFAERSRLSVVSYESVAEGVLELVDGVYRFSKIVLRPTLVVGEGVAIDQASKTLHDAHASCIIAKSIRADVTMSPVIRHEVPGDRA